jgi:hypothetical protein
MAVTDTLAYYVMATVTCPIFAGKKYLGILLTLNFSNPECFILKPIYTLV